MRKIIFLLCTFVLCVNQLSAQVTAVEPDGAGTPENPYQITSLENLFWISDLAASVEQRQARNSAFYVQLNDVDASESINIAQGFRPIGIAAEGGFTGNYNGQGFTINSLTISKPTAITGFFASVNGGQISNLNLSNASVSGGTALGVLVGQLTDNGSVTNCNVLASNLVSLPTTNRQNIGGLVGQVSSSGKVTNSSVVNTSISATNSSRTGGLIGFLNAGVLGEPEVSRSFTQEVTINGDLEVGGFIGANTSANVNIQNSYAASNTVNGNNNLVGGFIGNLAAGNILNSYSTSDVSAVGGTPNGFGGGTGGTVTESFWDADLTNIASSSNGTSATTTQMNDLDFYLDAFWDFVCEVDNGTEDIWDISTSMNNGYPFFGNQNGNFPDAIQPDGDGTPENPYLIATLENLFWMTTTPASWDAHFLQINDIDAISTETWGCEGEGWIPVALDEQENFTGSYNGNNFIIDGLFLDRPDQSDLGLFSTTQEAILENINLVNINFTGNGRVAGLVGASDNTTFTNCSINGTINASSEFAGFLFASRKTTTSSVTNTVDNCHASGSITGIQRVGGLVGRLSGTIINSSAQVSVTGTSNIGGLVGSVTGNATRIDQSFATGSVLATSRAGGFVGEVLNGAIIENSYTRASVTRSSGNDGTLAGFVGIVTGTGSAIIKSYAASQVTVGRTDRGFAGTVSSGGTINNTNFWDNSFGQTGTLGNAVGQNTANMTQPTIFLNAGWDFVCETTNGTEDIWSINDGVNNNYPNFDGEDFLFIEAIQPDGDGSEENPYLIANLGNLYWVTTNPASWDANFLQINDVDASATAIWGCNDEGWIPIGVNDTSNFTGVYEGGGFEISGLTINADIPNAGFFDILAGEVNNLKFDNANFEGEVTNLGVLAGQISTGADVFRVYVLEGNELSSTANPANVGGLVGLMNDGLVAQSFSNALVSTTFNLVGGFVGQMSGGEINNSYSRANVNAGIGLGGGFVGEVSEGIINKTYTSSQLNFSDLPPFGTGSVNAFGSQTGGTVTNSFYDSDVLVTDDSDATGQPTAEMTQETIFLAADWDFVCETENGTDDIWRIAASTNANYPFFNDEIDEAVLQPEGTGTEEDPYLIADLANLIWVANNPTEWSAFYQQTADIDVSETLQFSCPGEEVFQIIAQLDTEAFGGNYNGQGFSIQNLTLDQEDDRIAFFGTLDGATIENVVFNDAVVIGNSNIGVLAGIIQNSNINSITISGSVTQNDELGLINIGGLSGSIVNATLDSITVNNLNLISKGINSGGLAGKINGSSLSGISISEATLAGNNETGGVAGFIENETSIDNAVVMITITAEEDSENIGGIAGLANNSSISNSSFEGRLDLLTINNLGGIVGNLQNGGVSNINVTESIDIEGKTAVGGIVGVGTNAVVQSSTNFASVNGQENVGGIIGSSQNTSLIGNINQGPVSGSNNNVGGIVGVLSGGDATSNTNNSNVVGPLNTGGIVGSALNSSLDNNLNTFAINAQNQTGGIVGLMQDVDFTNNTNSANVTGTEDTGGLIGLVSGTANSLSGNTNEANVTGTNNVGGLFGRINAAILLSGLSVENITVSGTNRTGGMVGNLGVSAVINQSFTSNLTISNTAPGNRIGGFVGENNGSIVESYVHDISFNFSDGLNNSGGFVGEMAGSSVIQDSYILSISADAFNGNIGTAVGGFVGNANGGTISTAYAAVNSEKNGFTGIGTGTSIENSFYDEELAEGNTDSSATATSTEDMQLEITFTAATWDFECEDTNGSDYIWGINTQDNQEYPFLTWQGFESECRFEANWNGSVSEDWATAENWDENVVPASGASVNIPFDGIPNFPLLDGDRTIGAAQIQTGATISLGGNVLTIQGNIVGGGSFIGSKTSAIALTQGGSVSLRMNQDTNEETNILGQLIVDRESRQVTNVNQLYVADLLDVASGEFATSDALTMFCDWDNNRKVGQIEALGASGSITGSVLGEQCFPARRAFRFISPSLSMTTTIHASWQEGALSHNDASIPAGYGTHITGNGFTSPTPTLNADNNFFDWNPSGNPSLFQYNVGSQNWSAVGSTNQSLNTDQAVRLLVRGDRTINIAQNASNPTDTKLRTRGSAFPNPDLSRSFSGVDEGDLIMLGNPFWAQVDLTQVIEDSSGLQNFFYYWDPSLGGNPTPGVPGGRGAWVAYLTGSFGDFEAGDTVEYDLEGEASASDSDVSNLMQPMQAVMFVASNAGSATVNYSNTRITTEESQVQVFNTSDRKYINLQLFKQNDMFSPLDGLRIMFDEGGNNAIGGGDIPKLTNLDENFARRINNQLFMVEHRNNPDVGDLLPLFINTFRHSNYKIKINSSDFGNVRPYLIDNYTEDEVELTPGENEYNFSVVLNVPQTVASNRFRIEFKEVNLTVSEFEKHGISIYPNPVKNNFNIALPASANAYDFEIFDLLGRKVDKATFNHTSLINSIIVQDFNQPSGVYLIQLNTPGEKPVTLKLIKE